MTSKTGRGILFSDKGRSEPLRRKKRDVISYDSKGSVSPISTAAERVNRRLGGRKKKGQGGGGGGGKETSRQRGEEIEDFFFGKRGPLFMGGR